MKMLCSLYATMDQGTVLYIIQCDNKSLLYSLSSVETMLVSLPIPLAQGHVNPALTLTNTASGISVVCIC